MLAIVSGANVNQLSCVPKKICPANNTSFSFKYELILNLY